MINEELLKFVKSQMAANVPKEQIAAILKPGGWTDADVAEALKALHVNVVQKPSASIPPPSPVFQRKDFGVNLNTVQPVSTPVAPSTNSSVATTPVPAEVKTQFQTTFRLQTMPAAPASKKKWPLIFVLILFVLVFVGAGVWYFRYRSKAPAVTEAPQGQTIPVEPEKTAPVETPPPAPAAVAPFDQDLLLNWAKVPDEQNSAAAVASAAAMITKPDSDFLLKFFGKGYDAKSLPTPSAATAVAARNVKTLQAFSAASASPSYQCSPVLMAGQCNLEPLRNIGRLLLLRSYVLENAGKMSEAVSVSQSLVDLGRKVTASSDDIVTTLIGWNLQKDGYQRITLLDPKLSTPLVVSGDEKTSRVRALRDEHKNVFKIAYSREAEFLEYLADKNKVPSFPQSAKDISAADEYRKSITPQSFNLTETKKYFYDSYKTQIANVDVACGGPLAKNPYDFSAEVNVATSTNGQASVENYVGKILYWTTFTSFDSMNAKRCEVDDAINKL